MALKRKTFEPGEYLFKEKEISYFFFFLDEGEVEIVKEGDKGKNISLAVIGPGSPVGEFAMIDKRPRSASAVAKTPVVASYVSEVDYRAILADLPHWAVSMMNSLVFRLRDVNEVLLKNGLLYEDLKEKVEKSGDDSGNKAAG